jgi:phage tail sheath gpL-like
MKTLSAAALAAAIFAAALPATAAMNHASITLAAPMAGATLDAGTVDMSVYYTATADKTFEVVATYVSDAAPEKPLQLSMALADGDNVHFGLPGHPETLFSFARHGNAVTVSSQLAAVAASTGA